VVDRYSYSGAAYSASKGLDVDWCIAPERGLPAPDLVVFLSLSPGEAAARGGFGEERYRNKGRAVARRISLWAPETSTWTTVDAKREHDVI